MKKTVAILALAIVLVSVMSYSYASLNGTTKTCSCFGIEFTAVSVSDNEIGRDIGKVWAQITCDGKRIDVHMTQAYPSYEAYVNFTIMNTGTLPIHIDEVRVGPYDRDALEIETTNLAACTWISPGRTLRASEAVTILVGARQGWSYAFTVEIKTSCQPLQHPRSVGFWKHEFSVALGEILGEQHITPATLESYLNQITSQSRVLRFTGTQKQKFTQALSILQILSNANMEAKLKSQLLALWLNYVAGWTTGYALCGMTAQQIIEGSENALLSHRTNQYGYWKDLCDGFNNIGET